MDELEIAVTADRLSLKLDKINDRARANLMTTEEALAQKLHSRIVAAWPKRTGKSARRFYHQVRQGKNSVTAKVAGRSPVTHLVEGGAHIPAHLIMVNTKQAMHFTGSAGEVFAKSVRHPAVTLPAREIIHKQFQAMMPEIHEGIERAVKSAGQSA